MRDKIAVGMMVKCCESYEEVRQGDTGRVTKVLSSACEVFRDNVDQLGSIQLLCRC